MNMVSPKIFNTFQKNEEMKNDEYENIIRCDSISIICSFNDMMMMMRMDFLKILCNCQRNLNS